ncbi:MAG TPA: hypothetical protein VIL86_16390 [Tepidisphaeraceae bacterium]
MLLCASLLLASGCCRCGKKSPPYTGKTEPLETVIENINANNQKLPTLWAHQNYTVILVDPKNNKTHRVDGGGTLLYRRQRDFRLTGTSVAGRIFDIGSNDDRFWVMVLPEVSTLWWGNYRNIGEPCMREIPIRPDMVLGVLGVATLSDNLLKSPMPVMRFNNDEDAYMVTWVVKGVDRLLAVKEVWYDRQTLRPRLVLLYDESGRVALRAYLSRYVQVDLENVAKSDRPWVASNYDLFFPETKTKMTLSLSDVQLEARGFPNDRSFVLRTDDPLKLGVNRVIQIDADCGQ